MEDNDTFHHPDGRLFDGPDALKDGQVSYTRFLSNPGGPPAGASSQTLPRKVREWLTLTPYPSLRRLKVPHPPSHPLTLSPSFCQSARPPPPVPYPCARAVGVGDTGRLDAAGGEVGGTSVDALGHLRLHEEEARARGRGRGARSEPARGGASWG